MFHLYTSSGFESAHKTLPAASRAADRAAKVHGLDGVRVIECREGHETTGTERPAYEPGFVVLCGGSLGIFGRARTRTEARVMAHTAKVQGLAGEIVTAAELC